MRYAPLLFSVALVALAAACPKPVAAPPSPVADPQAASPSASPEEGARGVLSDARFKRDVTSIDDGLVTTLALNPVRFLYDSSETPFLLVPEGPQLGLIAQEVLEVLPAVVWEELDGYYRIEYEQLIPVLVDAVQEQQALIEAERARVDGALARIQSLEASLQRIAESAKPPAAAQ